MAIILITGAGRKAGLGYETAKQLVEAGNQVYLTARNIEQVEPLAQELSQSNSNAWALELDINDPESIKHAATEVSQKTGKLDVLVNNAAYMRDGSTILEDDRDQLQLDFNTNVIGPWMVTKEFYPLLVKSDHPRVVNVSSGAGSFGDHDYGLIENEFGNQVTPYGITKLALNGVTVKMAKEFAKDKILVNSVCPDVTDTFGNGTGWGRPVSESAKSVTWAVNLSDNGPTGGFFRDGKRLPW